MKDESIIRRRVYDHRLRDYVRETSEVSFAVSLGVPRSTARSWLVAPIRSVVSHEVFDLNDVQVRARILRLERRVKVLAAIMGLLLTLIRISCTRLDGSRVPRGKDKIRLLRAIDRARVILGLRSALKIVGLSATRFHSWIRSRESGCNLDDLASCPKTNPRQLLPIEMRTIKEMVTLEDYRHVPTGVLSILAQRLGKVFATPATWYRSVRERGWRRPRIRIHPSKPKVGLRTNKPNAMWHIDTTVVRLLDGTKAYLQAIIDNYSRRILAWRLGEKLDPMATAGLLVKAFESTRGAVNRAAQELMVDGGVENFNTAVEELVSKGILKLILAQTDISFSNSLIEAFWRNLKHQYLFINQLDTIGKLRGLAGFYIEQYNSHMPHSAHQGQTPDEMYFGTGGGVPDELAAARHKAIQVRLQANRNMTCDVCEAMPGLRMVANG